MITVKEYEMAKVIVREFELNNERNKTSLLTFAIWLENNEEAFYSRTGLTARVSNFFNRNTIITLKDDVLPKFIEDINWEDVRKLRNFGEATWLQFQGLRDYYLQNKEI